MNKLLKDERIRCNLADLVLPDLLEAETLRLLGNFELVLTANDEMTDYVWADIYDESKEEYVAQFSLENSYLKEIKTMNNFRPLTEADMLDIYESFLLWRTDPDDVQDSWWAGHGYDSGEFEFDIHCVLGYEGEDETDPSDWGIWLYPVSPPDYQIPRTGIDVTDEFKAWKLKHEEQLKGDKD